jgi:hypothetical protein
MKSTSNTTKMNSKFSTTVDTNPSIRLSFQHLLCTSHFDKFDGQVGVTSIIVNKKCLT